jgi:hypothetical protein
MECFQAAHVGFPVPAAYVPVAQLAHTAAPAADEVPSGQAAQAAAEVAPAEGEAEPAEHEVQGSALPPAAHEPAAHCVHTDAPAAEAEPAAHATQVEAEVAPKAEEKVPAAQAEAGAPPPAQK